MPITRKPKPANGHSPAADVKAITALIGKGGSPARTGRTAEFSTAVDIPVIVRVPEAELIAVDSLVMRRPVKTPRHTWLLEAIHEKIVREREAHAAELSEAKGKRHA